MLNAPFLLLMEDALTFAQLDFSLKQVAETALNVMIDVSLVMEQQIDVHHVLLVLPIMELVFRLALLTQ